MPDIERVRDLARAVLEESWREADGFCPPNPVAYPHQWLWDSCFHAIAWAALDDARAGRELASCLSGALPSGFVPHIRYATPSGGRGLLPDIEAGDQALRHRFGQDASLREGAQEVHDRRRSLSRVRGRDELTRPAAADPDPGPDAAAQAHRPPGDRARHRPGCVSAGGRGSSPSPAARSASGRDNSSSTRWRAAVALSIACWSELLALSARYTSCRRCSTSPSGDWRPRYAVS